jgi:hypothetical protein
VRLKQGVPTFCKSGARARDDQGGFPSSPRLPLDRIQFSPHGQTAPWVRVQGRAHAPIGTQTPTSPFFFFHGMFTVYLYPNVLPTALP